MISTSHTLTLEDIPSAILLITSVRVIRLISGIDINADPDRLRPEGECGVK